MDSKLNDVRPDHAVPVLYTTGQVAEILRISPQRVRALVHEGTLKAFWIGSELRIRLIDLQQFLADHQVVEKALE